MVMFLPVPSALARYCTNARPYFSGSSFSDFEAPIAGWQGPTLPPTPPHGASSKLNTARGGVRPSHFDLSNVWSREYIQIRSGVPLLSPSRLTNDGEDTEAELWFDFKFD